MRVDLRASTGAEGVLGERGLRSLGCWKRRGGRGGVRGRESVRTGSGGGLQWRGGGAGRLACAESKHVETEETRAAEGKGLGSGSWEDPRTGRAAGAAASLRLCAAWLTPRFASIIRFLRILSCLRTERAGGRSVGAMSPRVERGQTKGHQGTTDGAPLELQGVRGLDRRERGGRGRGHGRGRRLARGRGFLLLPLRPPRRLGGRLGGRGRRGRLRSHRRALVDVGSRRLPPARGRHGRGGLPAREVLVVLKRLLELSNLRRRMRGE